MYFTVGMSNGNLASFLPRMTTTSLHPPAAPPPDCGNPSPVPSPPPTTATARSPPPPPTPAPPTAQ